MSRPSCSAEGRGWGLSAWGLRVAGWDVSRAMPCLEIFSIPARIPSPFLQVLKSQRWEKKQAAAEELGTSQMHQPSAKVGTGQATVPSSRDNPVAGETLNPAPGNVPITSPPAPTGPGLHRERSAGPAARNPNDPNRCQLGAGRSGVWGQARIPWLGGRYVGTEHRVTWWGNDFGGAGRGLGVSFKVLSSAPPCHPHSPSPTPRRSGCQ